MRRLIAAFAALMLLVAGMPAAAATAPLCQGCCDRSAVQAGNAPLSACCRLAPSEPRKARETVTRPLAPSTTLVRDLRAHGGQHAVDTAARGVSDHLLGDRRVAVLRI